MWLGFDILMGLEVFASWTAAWIAKCHTWMGYCEGIHLRVKHGAAQIKGGVETADVSIVFQEL